MSFSSLQHVFTNVMGQPALHVME